MSRTSDDLRARRSGVAALAAATELLLEGSPESVTHASVAARAGVGRATVYRHWPDLESLLLDTLAGAARLLLTLRTVPCVSNLSGISSSSRSGSTSRSPPPSSTGPNGMTGCGASATRGSAVPTSTWRTQRSNVVSSGPVSRTTSGK
ncbi:TetR/AcrR family transcriptional regulator [Streptomyces sp. NPDC046909]|uniref:TetR/AcrR family transcriptional regulator n=1 Tax=Streptomyces sp. NPDC046909 TaxID=3155617 RepID=UPI0033C4E80E